MAESRNRTRDILVIDDDRDFSRSLQLQLKLEGHSCRIAHTGEEGLDEVRRAAPEVILLDLKLRETDGLTILDRLHGAGLEVPVIMITGEQDMKANIQAIQKGVLDYLRKPFSLEALLALLDQLGPMDAEPEATVVAVPETAVNQREIVGADPAILGLIKQIGLLSQSRVNVLITGESGTGKEMVGRALHDAASAEAPFVAFNCTALVPTLLESELFGHVKGAFTGAHADKQGLLAKAGNGTLFLDEIGDLPLDLQPKLLRVIQEREFCPVGSHTPLPFEARVVAATHRDLRQMIGNGQFREDLYYRLSVTCLEIPPLRQRRGGIELLTTHLLRRISKDLGKPVSGISSAVLQKLRQHAWPGNVRELENVLTRAVALAHSEVIREVALEAALTDASAAVEVRGTLSDAECAHIRRALDECDWNITHAANRLGISRPTLRKKIADFGLGE